MRARFLFAWLLAALAGCTPEPDPAAHCAPRDALECATDVGGALPLVLEGSTAGAEDTFQRSRCGIGGGLAIEDAAYRWTAPRAGRYRFDASGSSFRALLSVRRDGCGGSELACDASEDGASVEVELSECESVVVVIDGSDGAGVGAFRVAVTASEGACDDGQDGDGDGLVDCADSDCAGPRCDDPGAWPTAWVALEAEVLELVNQRRSEGATCGGVTFAPAPPLEHDVLLERAARAHSMDMAEQRYFDHQSLDGRMLDDRLGEVGYDGSGPIGENIAWGQATAAQVMDGWMNSPGHCMNIMEPGYRRLGVGYASVDGGDGPRWTQNFGGGR